MYRSRSMKMRDLYKYMYVHFARVAKDHVVVMEINTDCETTDCETKTSEPLDSIFLFSSISETKYCNLAMAPSLVDEYR